MARVLVAATGGVAAIKVPHLLRLLRAAGHEVRVLATPRALEFVTPLSLAVAAGGEVATEEAWFRPDGRALHIELARFADVVLVAPATADALAKAALGLADDLLSATLLAGAKRVAWAPAMNQAMWLAPQTQAHVERLKALGHAVFGPAYGPLAAVGEGEGWGRMLEPEELVERLHAFLTPKDLQGLRLLVSAGPTREYLDPVRFLSNPSSGRMGYAVAEAARDRGAEVVLVAGPTCLPDPWGVEVVRVESALEMRDRLRERYPWAQGVVMAAAVADYRPAEVLAEKEPKVEAERTLRLVPNPDILKELGQEKGDKVLVGFAMETGEGLERAKGKLWRKNLDLIVLNWVNREGVGFGSPENEVVLLLKDGRILELPRMSKRQVADRILDFVKEFWQA
ncbi:MAG: bifunctional phosphopantothenoylcysteine decarboxylase/phosphopantothenate--cysteine ligase CoaBC [Thermus sp.]|uniref:bifunctional phosphopantothenoylcysteine decarboxylase/phosphopantothenate--cysteine ligase CoaBC n=1 Tax=Thermus sp. TaxID=275 RepID=UPI0025E41434|nr:bifunctional phosphopantothenoylcysteine decarboxylase/phosphopantothenate--cysteine ligase CoaBC [Thermus sp.]MCS6868579.1 bifunctional phosphopantothenoylcysteine decarboxylase/phosphopantothenate--cysteine ligase CoaBC [Thermus sp.]MCS7218437.1 bifunctional phosphopantothenoylcysteine decarboxylase/phosphopantothenate--cysteine ligase CoaBC [Thermus sp.]MCX7849240.1 bifunctional phosphopantothenoylcysteine decarboxylase/phosphopantothenate--cysteine ligase CoaBC [Thermus sp.]MDW8356959.1 